MGDSCYIGGELGLFAAATVWKAYFRRHIQPYLGDDVLEVGAGLGGTTRLLCRPVDQRGAWVCLEPDAELAQGLDLAIARGELPDRCQVVVGTLDQIPTGSRFDTVLYIDVLEHIADDRGELSRAAARLMPGGHLVVLGPAHRWLFSPFDAAIGHHRRYTKSMLRGLAPEGLILVRSRYLDSIGLLASLGNRLFLRRSLPSPGQLAVWDKILVRCSRLVDPLLGYSLGKSVLGVWKKPFVPLVGPEQGASPMSDPDPPSRERSRKPLFHDQTIAGLLLLVGLLNSLLAFLVTVRDISQYPGVDLRCRVVAARAILMGLDPYQYEWREGMSEQLLDPGRRHPGPSRATYPPTLLMLYVPFSGFPYQTQRVIWFLLEWSALVMSLALLVAVVRSRAARTALLALAMFFFVSGELWRFHVERGQFYVFVLLLTSLGTRSLVRHGREGWWAGIFFGLAAALRPTFFLMAIPLAVLGYRKWAVAMAATLVTAVALTLPWVGLQGWVSYLSTMQVWEQAAAAEDQEKAVFLRRYGPARPVPTSAEGIDFLHNLPIETGGSTILANFHPVYSGLSRLVALPPLMTIARIGLLAFVFSVGGLAVSLRWRVGAVSPRFIAALGTLACIDGEYFLPIRYSYADILFLLPLALLIPALLRIERMGFARTFVIAGLVLGGYRSLIGSLAEPIEYLFLAFGLTIALLQLTAAYHAPADRPPRAAHLDRG